jgi:hypothetical protein
MPIVKSLKTKTGYPHRVHRSRKGRKPAKKYHGRKALLPYRQKREQLHIKALESDA